MEIVYKINEDLIKEIVSKHREIRDLDCILCSESPDRINPSSNSRGKLILDTIKLRDHKLEELSKLRQTYEEQ